MSAIIDWDQSVRRSLAEEYHTANDRRQKQIVQRLFQLCAEKYREPKPYDPNAWEVRSVMNYAIKNDVLRELNKFGSRNLTLRDIFMY